MRSSTIAAKDFLPVGRRETALGLPPVIVLNLFHSGLGIVRQLSGRGVRVVGLSANPDAYGNLTRLCQVRTAPDSQKQPKELKDFLLNTAFHLKGAIIFPTRDADVLFLDTFRDNLEQHYKLAIPSSKALISVMNKARLAEVATAEGVSVPLTKVVSDAAQLTRAAEEVGFPCVVKPVHSVQWRLGNNWNLVGARKAFRVTSLSELEQEYKQVSEASPNILLQQWIPGNADQLVIWGGYVHPGSEPAYFTARKIVQSPEEFGTGCVVENESISELVEPSLRLCRALGYEGMAEIEYKRDARDGSFKLIEVNPRHWDWHQLGNASGVDLSWIAYSHLSGKSVQPMKPQHVSAQWVAEDLLLLHVLRSARRGNFAPLKALRLLSTRHMYSIWSWKDMLPFFRYFLTILFPVVFRTVARKFGNKLLVKHSRKSAGSAQQVSRFVANELCAPPLGVAAGRKNQR